MGYGLESLAYLICIYWDTALSIPQVRIHPCHSASPNDSATSVALSPMRKTVVYLQTTVKPSGAQDDAVIVD